MASKTVIIDCDEEGNYSVGMKPASEGMGAMGEGSMAGMPGEGPDMQPAESLDAALEQARALFAEDKDSEQEDADMAEGYAMANNQSMMSRRGGMGGM